MIIYVRLETGMAKDINYATHIMFMAGLYNALDWKVE